MSRPAAATTWPTCEHIRNDRHRQDHKAEWTDLDPNDPSSKFEISVKGELILAGTPETSNSADPPFVIHGNFHASGEVANLTAADESCHGPQETFNSYDVGTGFVCGITTDNTETCFGTSQMHGFEIDNDYQSISAAEYATGLRTGPQQLGRQLLR